MAATGAQAREPPPQACDVAIVGGGIVGLAVARELGRRSPRASVCVLEREQRLAQHQTGHSSGVIHSGIYYRPGSLKARLCVAGARELYEYCEARGIPHVRCGKVILASTPAELPLLQELERRGKANAVPGLRIIDAAGLEGVEPHARALAALHSPATGIVDFDAVARALAGDIRQAGGRVSTGCRVVGVTKASGALKLSLDHAQVRARNAVFCAGAWADRLAVAAGADADPRIVPFRGAYRRLPATHRHLVKALIYPVPDPALPFLGVHLSRRIDGEVLVGPTALIAAARDGHRGAALCWEDLRDTLAWPGTWRLARRWWRPALREARRASLPAALARDASRYVPELRGVALAPAGAGIRAQALTRDGTLVDDFHLSLTERALHVRNAPSPAATAALAIARHIADEVGERLGV